MRAPEFPIAIHDLDAGGKLVHLPVRAAWIRSAFGGHEATAAGSDGAFDVRVSKSGQDVLVHGTLRAELSVPCARCLTQTTIAVNELVSVLAVPAAAPKDQSGEGDEYEFSSQEADVISYEGDLLVLDDLVRDELMLQIPMAPLCSEDCPGMTPASPDEEVQSNPERSVDPRLMPLLKFKKDR